ncbi:hypothetical protein [Bdellovibrio sp. GT3]|uniref:hypothetical protein n=1 Tax=Bdellovibrio sp. GT3 TaxID=3136282 RepID=UPI0030F00AA6
MNVKVVAASFGFLGLLCYWGLQKNQPDSAGIEPLQGLQEVTGTRSSGRSPASVSADDEASKGSLPSTEEVQGQSPFYKKYFSEKLLKNEDVAELNAQLEGMLPKNKSVNQIRHYIAAGLVMENTPEFYEFMGTMISDLNDNKEEVVKEILLNDAILKQDPFIHQMTLNLVHALDIPADQKAEVLGKALDLEFSFDEKGEASASATNITNALLLMTQSGVALEQATPYLLRGVQINQKSPKALSEYLARVQIYYPDFVYE